MIGAIIVLIVLVVCLLTAFNNDLLYQKQISERMYSEEEVERIARDAYEMGRKNILIGVFNKWFEQFKKK